MRKIILNDALHTELEVTLFTVTRDLLWITLKDKNLTFLYLATLFEDPAATGLIEEYRGEDKYNTVEGFTSLVQINKTEYGIDIGLRHE